MPRTIALKGDFVRKEAIASAAITPGMLVQFGGAKELQKHGTANGVARKAFALENDLIGKGITDDYAANEVVQYGVFYQGAEVYALLKTGNNAAKGDALCSGGAGNLQKTSASGGNDDEEIVAYALEAVNNASGVDQRIRVEVA